MGEINRGLRFNRKWGGLTSTPDKQDAHAPLCAPEGSAEHIAQGQETEPHYVAPLQGADPFSHQPRTSSAVGGRSPGLCCPPRGASASLRPCREWWAEISPVSWPRNPSLVSRRHPISHRPTTGRV